ncbi:MAG: grasp-with-spasm system SPASM domain peptide maturase [Dinghuibacter sp.]|nr:grasp-with-spasm system SPASM domain peptide maturase [Dinghuibacter sp.]
MTPDNKKYYFCRYAHFLVTRGQSRSLITDVHGEATFFIPNDLCDLLQQYNGKKIADVYREYGRANSKILDEYFEFLFAKDIIFLCSSEAEVQRFPPLSMEWDFPATVSNAIVDVSAASKHPWKKILGALDELNCPYLQVRCYNGFTLQRAVKEILAYLDAEESVVVNVELFLPYQQGYSEKQYRDFLSAHKRIGMLVVHGAPFTKKTEIKKGNLATLYFTQEAFENSTCCGVVHPQYFSANMNHFTESLQFNSCLNRKISIDERGYIKNCPSMQQHFGHIDSVSLTTALNKPGFTALWNITKNEIDTCKQCEFRNICTDCRAYVQTPGNQYSKPLKCGYDPETCTWNNWSEHPLSRLAAEHYGIAQPVATA